MATTVYEREIFNAVLTEPPPGLFGYNRQIERVETIANKFEIFGSHF